jgi:hypothetical protein
MITVNSLSGGKTSSFMAVHHPADVQIFACVCIDYEKAKPKDPAIFKYASEKLSGNFIASAEHDKTLKVMMQLEQLIGKEIIWVRGKSFDKVIDEAGCLPTWARRFCTTELKIRPMFEYLYFRYGITNMQIGFRGDEMDRIIKAQSEDKSYFDYPTLCRLYGKRKKIWNSIKWRIAAFPLRGTFHYQIIKYWKYVHPEFDFPIDSNCRGCHHKQKELIKQNWLETPEHLEWFALQEEKGKYNTWHDDQVSYRKIFASNFTEKIDFDYPGCSTGFCTD